MLSFSSPSYEIHDSSLYIRVIVIEPIEVESYIVLLIGRKKTFDVGSVASLNKEFSDALVYIAG